MIKFLKSLTHLSKGIAVTRSNFKSYLDPEILEVICTFPSLVAWGVVRGKLHKGLIDDLKLASKLISHDGSLISFTKYVNIRVDEMNDDLQK